MALLKHLQICGIRSFGSDDLDSQSITFDLPLTLILGRNGCGKTTIIEALKYACIGTMPYGQGNSFVRDPKLDRKVETRAQIKLKFISCQGKGVTITRSMSSTQKVKNLQFKTLEAIASVVDGNGKVNQVSSRCNNIDELMSLHFGVSKPILNYVIFCHQEDSHWPLDESKKVKEKFDEIFDSSKYNKCMNSIRSLRKDVMTEAKLAKESLIYLEENVTLVKSKRGELENIVKRYNESLDKKNEIEKQISECKKEYDDWKSKLDDFKKIQSDRDNAAAQVKNTESLVKGMMDLISFEFTGTEEELSDAIINFGRQLHDKKVAYEQVQNKLGNIESRESSIRTQINDVQIKIGKLQEARQQERDLQEKRNRKLSELARMCGLSPLPNGPSEADVNDLFAKVDKEFYKLNSLISSMKRTNEEEQNNCQDELNKCVESKNKVRFDIGKKEEDISSNKSEIRKLKDTLKEVDLNLKRKDRIDADLEKCCEDLTKAQNSEDSNALATEIENLKTQCKELEDRQKQLTAEVRSLSSFQEKQKDLQKCEERYQELLASIRRLRSSNDEFISQHLKLSDDKTIKYDFETLKSKLKREIQDLENQLTSKRQEVSSLDQQRKFKKDQLKKKEDELAKNEESLYQVCGTKNLDDVLLVVETEIEKAQTEKGVLQASSLVYQRFVKDMKGPENCCPLCLRNFESEYQSLKLIDELNEKVAALPNRTGDVSIKLCELQKKQSNLLQLKPVQKITSNIKLTEIPQLKKELKDIEENLDNANEEISCLEGNLQVPKVYLRDAEMVLNDIFDIDRHSKEAKQLERRIDELKKSLPSANSSLTFDQALAQQQFVQDELTAKRTDKDEAEKRQNNYLKGINDLEKKRNVLVAEQLKIKDLVQQEAATRERLTELAALNDTLEIEMADLVLNLGPAEERERKAKEVLNSLKRHHREEIEKKEKEKEKKSSEISSIQELQKSIAILKSKNIPEALKQQNEELKKLNQGTDDLKLERDRLQNDSTILTNDIESHKQREKELKINQSLMQRRNEITKWKKILENFEQTLGGLDILGVQSKCDDLFVSHTRLTRRKNELSGNLQELEENIQSRKNELEKPIYKTAEKKYQEKFIFLTVRNEVEKDLQKYYNALDFALQHFHKDRMASINKIIRELWRLIYKGNDIDYIEIKTDETTPTATSGLDKKRVYNYCVVQVKNGTEIEMRNRCSAGQKVLASLIIRMALAETFSANCGILTLDEPTTNLDKINIDSLATAISEIIREHHNKKNFQLIIITHDREFLNSLSDAEFFDHYWEVSRTNESKSRIKRKTANYQ